MNAIIALMVIINIHLSGQVGDRKDGGSNIFFSVLLQY